MSWSKLKPKPNSPVPKKMPTKPADMDGSKARQSSRWISGREPTAVSLQYSLSKLPIQPCSYRFARFEFVWLAAGNAKAVEAMATMSEV